MCVCVCVCVRVCGVWGGDKGADIQPLVSIAPIMHLCKPDALSSLPYTQNNSRNKVKATLCA